MVNFRGFVGRLLGKCGKYSEDSLVIDLFTCRRGALGERGGRKVWISLDF